VSRSTGRFRKNKEKIFAPSFCPFVYDKTAPKYIASCHIYFIYAKIIQTQTSRTNFANEQKVGFIKVSSAATITFVVTSL